MADYSMVSLLSDAELDAVTGGANWHKYYKQNAFASNSGNVAAESLTIGSITTINGVGAHSHVDVSNSNNTTSFTAALGAVAVTAA